MLRIGTTPKRFKRKGKELINAIPNIYDGIEFKSLQESNVYKYLKPIFGEKVRYEPETFSFYTSAPNNRIIWTKPKQGGGLLKEAKRLTHIEYTPDFIITLDRDTKFIIEVKGRPNESWELKKRMFMHYIQDKYEIKGFFECSSIKQVQQVIQIIQDYERNKNVTCR